MIAVYTSDNEIIIVGTNADGRPIDGDGTLFGPKSGRDISDFERSDVDLDKGETIHVEQPYLNVRIK